MEIAIDGITVMAGVIHEQQDELKRLRAELAAEKRDADLFRWLVSGGGTTLLIELCCTFYAGRRGAVMTDAETIKALQAELAKSIGREWAAVEAEKERCAKIVDHYAAHYNRQPIGDVLDSAAAAIRASNAVPPQGAQ